MQVYLSEHIAPSAYARLARHFEIVDNFDPPEQLAAMIIRRAVVPRTVIARAWAINPAFILLDEPFAGGDPIAVEDIQSIVATLKHKNIGVIITDHNVDETLAITDRTYLLYEGKILKTGTAEELAADPMVRKVYLGQHFELKKSHQLTQEMKNRKGQEVNE